MGTFTFGPKSNEKWIEETKPKRPCSVSKTMTTTKQVTEQASIHMVSGTPTPTPLPLSYPGRADFSYMKKSNNH